MPANGATDGRGGHFLLLFFSVSLWFKSFVAALQNRYHTAMKRLALGVFVLTLVGAAVVLSQTGTGPGKTAFLSEPRNPVSHLRWNDDPSEFRFAIVSDRTGTHRANVFAQAVAKLNLLQPEFVITVGDLIEGDKQPPLAVTVVAGDNRLTLELKK